MTFLAAHAGGHPSGCPHRAGLILSKKEKKKKKKKRKREKERKEKYITLILFRVSPGHSLQINRKNTCDGQQILS